MRTQLPSPFILLCGVAVSVVCCSHAAIEVTDAKVAEVLGTLRCRVELTLADGKVSVVGVDASGRITADGLRTEPLSEQLFACLKSLHRLRKLRLDIQEGEADLAYLRSVAQLHSLRELELHGQHVKDEAMTCIGSLTNLESLRVWDVAIGDQGLARLANLKALTRLEFSSFKPMNRRGVEAIAKLPALEYLQIYGQVEGGALSALGPLKKLHTVWIGGSQINGMLSDLKNVSTIQRVEIARSRIDPVTAKHLLGMKNLQSLKLECCVVLPEAIKNLNALHLQRFQCVAIDTKALSELAKDLAEGYGDLDVRH